MTPAAERQSEGLTAGTPAWFPQRCRQKAVNNLSQAEHEAWGKAARLKHTSEAELPGQEGKESSRTQKRVPTQRMGAAKSHAENSERGASASWPKTPRGHSLQETQSTSSATSHTRQEALFHPRSQEPIRAVTRARNLVVLTVPHVPPSRMLPCLLARH